MKQSNNHYEELSSIYYPHDITGDDKDIVGDSNINTCLFCGRTRPNVTFKKDAHVIPAGLGNRTLFYLNECDQCNAKFSLYENELINYLTFDRIFIGASKRPGSGAPKYKNKSKLSSLEMSGRTLKLNILEEEGTFHIKKRKGKLLFEIKNPPPYRPDNICKCLTHMAWALLEDEDKAVVSYEPDWLIGSVNVYPLYMDTAFVPGNGFSHVILEVFKSTGDESQDYPYLIRFTYGLHIISFYLPKNPNIKLEPVRFTYCAHIPPDKAVHPITWTIPSDERIKPDNICYEWNYRKIEKESILKRAKRLLAKLFRKVMVSLKRG
ncbi:HNH endonuclease [Paenibacillus validus]|uniref:HNH endonuclease n=1 Tax=Paenibacillus validus TaxID=44253 RepID=UPI003D2D6F7A